MISRSSILVGVSLFVAWLLSLPAIADPVVWDLEYEPFGPDDIPTIWLIQGGAFILAIVIAVTVGFVLVRRLVRRTTRAL